MYDFTPLLRSNVWLQDQGGIAVDTTQRRNVITEQDVVAYDERSGSFDISRALERRRPDFTRPLRDLGTDAVILELAAGRAAHSLSLLRDGYNVLVSDVSPKSVLWVRAAATALGIADRANFLALDAMHLPFKDESVDGVFMTASLHHMPDPYRCVCECRRVIKPGGLLLIGYEPAHWTYIIFGTLWRLLRGALRRGKRRNISLADDATTGFSARQLLEFARRADFQEAEVQGVDFLEKIAEHAQVLVQKLLNTEDSEYRPSYPMLRKLDQLIFRRGILARVAWNYDLIAYRGPDKLSATR